MMQALRGLESRLGGWAIGRRWPIVAAALVMSGIAASGTAFLEFSADDRIYFSRDNPQLLASEAMENTYGKSSNVFFAVVPEDRDATSAIALEAALWLTDRAWQIPFATRVDSLTNFQHSTADGDDILVRDLVDGSAPGDVEQRSRIRAIALAEPLLAGRLIARDGGLSGVNVAVALPGKDEMREGERVAEFAYGLADRVRERFPGIDVRVTGLVIFNQTFMQVSLRDLQTLVPATFATMTLMLLFLTGGLGGTFAIMLVVALSVMAAVGLGGWVGLPMTAPSAIAPVVVLTVAIASCVHIFSSFVHSMRGDTSGTPTGRATDTPLPFHRDGERKRNAIVEAMRVNLQPVFLACLTTAFGFLSMNFSEVPPLRHLGTFVAFGVGAAFVLSVTLLPALLSLLPVRVRAAGDRRDAAMAALGEFVIRRRRALGWGFGVIVIALLASIPRNELNDVFLHYFDESIEFRRDADFTVENLTGIYTMEYALASAGAEGIVDPAYLSDVAAFAEWYRAQPETIHVNVITDTFRRLNRSMHGDDPAEYRLPASEEQAAQYLLLYEISLPAGLDLNNQIAVDKSATRMTVATRTLSSNEVIALDRRALRWLADRAPHIVRAESAGGTLMFAHLGRRNIVAMLLGTTIALVGISLVLVLALRSLRLGIASLVPNLAPGALGFGIWGLAVGEVGVSLSMVSAMTLGIVVDDTVHFLSKYLRARRELGYASPDAVRVAFRTVGRALLTTSLVLVAGFVVVSLSSFELNAGMGKLTALVIALALVADFFLLPPLLMKIDAGAGTGARAPGPS
ncbi:MAG: MMPL family transporter [Defluviicoccus sp.]|nr:MMPL family transporter [Defluviicoccus sp.]MDE0274357.1 MMPL family transporter [Defluviicoccus sp.]